jgi:SAM-dependent methyltransferase
MLQKQWEKEFKKKGIPSSYKEEPSQSALWFAEHLSKHPKGSMLDIGCGKGRNSFFFHERGYRVSCIDFVGDNISHIKRANPKIDARRHDLANPFPFADAEFDSAIDIFCFKHLVKEPARQNYLSELKRIVKGTFLLSLASVEDGFYGPLLQYSPSPEKRLIVDPFTGIPSILYGKEDVLRLFEGFQLVAFNEKRNKGPMHGKEYDRCILSFIFQKVY